MIKKTGPTVSVVIPLFNKEKHIIRAIDSVSAQTFRDFEIIVVDDGSKDGSEAYVRSIQDSRLRLIQQANAGKSAARNRGIEEAHADLIALLDSDDVWKPLFLETVLRLMKDCPQAGAYATAYEIKERNGILRIAQYRAIPPTPWEGIIPNYFESALLGAAPVCSSAVMIPKESFKQCGCFPVGVELGEDLDMWLRIALKYPIAFSNYIGARYYQDADNRACEIHLPLQKYPFIHMAEKNQRLFLGEYINKCQILSAASCIHAGYVRLGRERLLLCHTKRFLFRKIYWLILSFLPSVWLDWLLRGKARVLSMRCFTNTGRKA